MAKLKNIPVDCAFPQLREIVDKRVLAKKLQRYMGQSFSSGEMYVEGLGKNHIYYKSGTDCRIRFAAKIRTRHSQEVGEQVFFGRLFHEKSGRAPRRFLNGRKLTQPKFGPAVMYIPEWAMVLWAYPNDPELPGLSHLFDGDKVLARMKAEPARFNFHQSPISITGKMTKYVPGKY